jgi:CRP/FNR family transcriptional regulator
MKDLEYLRGVSILSGLTDPQLAVLAASFHRRTYPARAIIFHQGEPGMALYIIIAGKVRVFMVSESGREMTADILGQGEVFGEMALLSNQPRSASIMAMTSTQVLTLDRDAFHAGLRAYPEIAVNILAVLANRLRATTTFASELVFNNLHGRVGHVLLALAERHGVMEDSTLSIDVPLTQTELANLVGTTRESVSRTLSVYEGHGVLRVAGTHFTILKPEALRRAAAREPALLDI